MLLVGIRGNAIRRYKKLHYCWRLVKVYCVCVTSVQHGLWLLQLSPLAVP